MENVMIEQSIYIYMENCSCLKYNNEVAPGNTATYRPTRESISKAAKMPLLNEINRIKDTWANIAGPGSPLCLWSDVNHDYGILWPRSQRHLRLKDSLKGNSFL